MRMAMAMAVRVHVRMIVAVIMIAVALLMVMVMVMVMVMGTIMLMGMIVVMMGIVIRHICSSASPRYRPSALRPGWSSGRRPGAQAYLRSLAAIGRSLMLAMRTRMSPCSSNSQFSLP